jgi:hypothetical protein
MSTLGGDLVLHTFMAEQSRVEVFLCTPSLPSSSDFRGQGGNLISASFSRMKNEGGGNLYQGRKVHQPTYVEEGDYF